MLSHMRAQGGSQGVYTVESTQGVYTVEHFTAVRPRGPLYELGRSAVHELFLDE